MTRAVAEIKCPNCGSTRNPIVNPETGEYVCPVCGYTYGFPVEPTRFRSREEYERKAHSERMPKAPDTTPRDIARQHVIGSRELARKKDRAARYAAILAQIEKEYNIPRYIIGEVEFYFEKIRNNGLLTGRSHRLIIAALLYALSRKYSNVNVQRDVIERIANAEIRRVYRMYRFLVKNGLIDQHRVKTSKKPSHYLPVIMSRLESQGRDDVRGDVQHIRRVPATTILKTADAFYTLFQGSKPAGVAAATLYFFSRLVGSRVNQNFIAKTAGISQLTVRRILKQILEGTNINIEV